MWEMLRYLKVFRVNNVNCVIKGECVGKKREYEGSNRCGIWVK